MIKNCVTIDEFLEDEKEYFKYHHNRWLVSESEVKGCVTGLSFKITTPEQFNDEKVRGIFGHNAAILDETIDLLGRYCQSTDASTDEGTFIGIEATEEDFYYMLQKSDGSISYLTCCGGIKDKFPNIEYEL